MRPRGLLVSRGGAGVSVLMPPDTFDRLIPHLHPYFGVRPIDEPVPGTWVVFAGREQAPRIRGFTPQMRPSPGEPTHAPLLSPDEKRVIVDYPEGAWRTLFTLRMVRKLLGWELFAQGALSLHGGLVEVRGQGVAYVGGKRAGKTSSIMALLTQPGVNFVTNDDLALLHGPDGLRALGWPRSIGVRRDTLLELQRAAPAALRFPACPLHPANTYAGAPQAGTGPEPERVFLFPVELAAAFGREVVGEAPLSTIVFPMFLAQGEHRVTLRRLQRGEAAGMLRESFKSVPDHHDAFLGDCFDTPRGAEPGLALEHLAATVPCYVLGQPFTGLLEGAHAVLSLVTGG